jgi:hypothetical protein
MMTINRAMAWATVLAIIPWGLPASAVVDDEVKGGIDAEGYLATWLVLAPIPLEANQDGAEGAAKEQVKDEAALNPKVGDKIKVADKELAWKEAGTDEGVLNLNAVVGQETEDSVGYAVTTIIAEEERTDVIFKVASDDQVRVYLNGKQIHANDEARSLDKDDADTIQGVTLKKGRNVLVLKVVNEPEDWEGSVRVLDKEGNPLKGITATTKPE